MTTLAEKLRIACEANGLGVSGSSAALLTRLVKGGDKDKKRSKDKKKKKPTTSTKKMVCKNGVCKPMKTVRYGTVTPTPSMEHRASTRQNAHQ
jgi:hypothetical protein